MNKFVKAPTGLLVAPFRQRYLELGDSRLVESCTHFQESTGSMYLQDHLLLFVLAGTYTVTHGGAQYVVRPGEMVLLQRAIRIDYYKVGDPADEYRFDCLLFFLTDGFIKEFAQRTTPRLPRANHLVPVAVRPVGPTIQGFLASIKPYFDDAQPVDGGLLRLKILELLYDLGRTAPGLLQQLLQLAKPLRAGIPEVIEANIGTGASLADLAYLAGRSLSSFKREFQAIYHAAPAQWLREQRMARARTLLRGTGANVTEVCYMLGFESVAHFSRLFKQHFGHSPSAAKHMALEA